MRRQNGSGSLSLGSLIFALAIISTACAGEVVVDVQTGGASLLIQPVDAGDRVDLILFLNDDLVDPPSEDGLPTAVKELMNEVGGDEGVMMIQYFSREMAEEEFAELFGDEESMMESLEGGLMLPTSLRIWTTSDTVTERLISRYEDDPRIRSIESAVEELQQLHDPLQQARRESRVLSEQSRNVRQTPWRILLAGAGWRRAHYVPIPDGF